MDEPTTTKLLEAIAVFKLKTGADLNLIIEFVKDVTSITTEFNIGIMKNKMEEITKRSNLTTDTDGEIH